MNELEGRVYGNVGKDPEIKYVNTSADGSVPVVNFEVAVTPRTRDRASGEWVNGKTYWVNCTAWRRLAENVAASFFRGTPVVLIGHYTEPYAWVETDEATGQVSARAKLNFTVTEAAISIGKHPAVSKQVDRAASTEKAAF